jgi:hypothetical protein
MFAEYKGEEFSMRGRKEEEVVHGRMQFLPFLDCRSRWNAKKKRKTRSEKMERNTNRDVLLALRVPFCFVGLEDSLLGLKEKGTLNTTEEERKNAFCSIASTSGVKEREEVEEESQRKINNFVFFFSKVFCVFVADDSAIKYSRAAGKKIAPQKVEDQLLSS